MSVLKVKCRIQEFRRQEICKCQKVRGRLLHPVKGARIRIRISTVESFKLFGGLCVKEYFILKDIFIPQLSSLNYHQEESLTLCTLCIFEPEESAFSIWFFTIVTLVRKPFKNRFHSIHLIVLMINKQKYNTLSNDLQLYFCSVCFSKNSN